MSVSPLIAQPPLRAPAAPSASASPVPCDLVGALDAAELGPTEYSPVVTRTPMQCSICLQGFGTRQAYRAAGCKHTFHRSCFEEHLTRQIRTGVTELTCPDCPRQVSEEELRKVVPAGMARRFVRLAHSGTGSLDTYCPGLFSKPKMLRTYLTITATLSTLLLTVTAASGGVGMAWAPIGPGGPWSVAAAACVAGAAVWAMLRKMLFRGAAGWLWQFIATVCAASNALGALVRRGLLPGKGALDR